MDAGAVQALVSVDVQRGHLFGPYCVPSADELHLTISRVIEAARSAEVLVVHVQHDGGPGAPDEIDTEGWLLCFEPWPGEPVLRKQTDDAFENPTLASVLRAAGARTVAIVGVQSEMCVSATARGV